MSRMQVVGSDRNHLKLTLIRQGHSLEAVGFRMGNLAEEIAPHSRPDFLGELTFNEWNNRRVPQLKIRDAAVNHVQVFDWRSNRIPEERLRAVADRPDAAVFASSPEGNGTGGVRLSWDMEEMPDLTSFRRLVFADLPPSLERFERVVRTASRVERLYFAYGDASLDPVFFTCSESGAVQASVCDPAAEKMGAPPAGPGGAASPDRNVQADDRLHFKGLFRIGISREGW